MHPTPHNLGLLHGGEEEIRVRSLAALGADDDHSGHLQFVERCMDLLQYTRAAYDHWDEDQLIIKLIGLSVFNAVASAWKLIAAGYYQSSGLQMRYVLETGWLMDYLRTEPGLVEKWKVTPRRNARMFSGQA